MPTSNMNFGVNLLPKTNDAYSLGNSEKQWQLNASTINGIAPGSSVLTTTAQTITGAINELRSDLNGLGQRIGSVESPASVFIDIQFSIAAADWVGNSAPYTVHYGSASITENSGIWVFYDESYTTYAQAGISAQVYYDNSLSPKGGILFSTNTKPTGTLTGYVRIVESVNGILSPSRGGTGFAAQDVAGVKSGLGVTALETKVGSATMGTTATTLTGAIKEVRDQIKYTTITPNSLSEFESTLQSLGNSLESEKATIHIIFNPAYSTSWPFTTEMYIGTLGKVGSVLVCKLSNGAKDITGRYINAWTWEGNTTITGTITASSGWTLDSTTRCEKKNGIVYIELQGYHSGSSMSVPGTYLLATIPSGFRPSTNKTFPTILSDVNGYKLVIGYIVLGVNGAVTLYVYTKPDTTGSIYSSFIISYIAA